MPIEIQELPEHGEIVIATIIRLNDHGAYVSIDEYDGMQGFLHKSEIAPGWIKSVGKHLKIGEKKVLLVKKVDIKSGDIDLSLKQVSNDQKKKKLLESKKYEKGKKIIQNIQKKYHVSKTDIESLEDSLYSRYDNIYDAFVDIASKGIAVISDLKLSRKITLSIEEASAKIKPPIVEIRGMLELSTKKPDGIDMIKKVLLNTIKNQEKCVKISYIGAPKYRLRIIRQDFKSAEKTLKPVLAEIKKKIEKAKGTFRFIREESKKTRQS